MKSTRHHNTRLAAVLDGQLTARDSLSARSGFLARRARIALILAVIASQTVCAGFGWAAPPRASLPAFPGAEGFGAQTPGGRGGRIIKVTNLNASGPGSLQAACDTKGPRIVVFDVAGVIRGDVLIRHPNITIAGQSAPLPGITVAGRLMAAPPDGERLHDVVVRFLRIRPPRVVRHDGDAIQFALTDRAVFDHLSLAWANDETIDIIYSSDITIQWSTIEESDPEGHAKGMPHNFGLLSAYPGSGNVSIHHNLFAHHARRLPSLAPGDVGKPADFRNNVIYNFRDGLSDEGHRPRSPINLIANYYKRGPDAFRVRLFHFHAEGSYFVSENQLDGNGILEDPRLPGATLPWFVRATGSGAILDAAAPVAPVSTHGAEEAYRRVIREAGAFPRDRITRRTIDEVQMGKGRWGRNGPIEPEDDWFLSGMPSAMPPRDSDGDGMPDAWEDRHGLSRDNARDAYRIMPSGYTAIEDYLNDRARELVRSDQ